MNIKNIHQYKYQPVFFILVNELGIGQKYVAAWKKRQQPIPYIV